MPHPKGSYHEREFYRESEPTSEDCLYLNVWTGAPHPCIQVTDDFAFKLDPLACPRCHGLMTIISIIEDPPVIKRILLHLHLWEVPKRSPPPRSPPRDFIYDLDFFSRQTG